MKASLVPDEDMNRPGLLLGQIAKLGLVPVQIHSRYPVEMGATTGDLH